MKCEYGFSPVHPPSIRNNAVTRTSHLKCHWTTHDQTAYIGMLALCCRFVTSELVQRNRFGIYGADYWRPLFHREEKVLCMTKH